MSFFNLSGLSSTKGKEKIKAKFDVDSIRLTNFPGQGKVVLSWKRGSQLNTGSLKDVAVNGGTAVWADSIHIEGSLWYTQVGDKWDEKILAITIKQGLKTLGRASIDLGKCNKHEGTYNVECPLGSPVPPQITLSSSSSSGSSTPLSSSPAVKPGTPILHLKIHTKWLKYNNKIMTKVDGSASSAGSSSSTTPSVEAGNVVDMDGELYQLRTDDHLTDTSVDTSLDDDLGEDAEGDPFVNAGMFEAEAKKAQDEADLLRKKLHMVEGESRQRNKTIQMQEGEIEKMRSQLDAMEQKLKENEEVMGKASAMEKYVQTTILALKDEHEQEVAKARNQARKEAEDAAAAQMAELRRELDAYRGKSPLDLLDDAVSHESKRDGSAHAHLEEELEKLNKTLDTTRESLKTKAEELERVQRHVSSLNSELDKRTLSQTTTQTKLLDVQSENERLKGNLSTREAELAEMKKNKSDGDNVSVLRKRVGSSSSHSVPSAGDTGPPLVEFQRMFRDPIINDNWMQMFFSCVLLIALLWSLLF
eukprot:TRINITY_DN3589_c0_g1_i3.p1 TRINITY_DN3589_c0_g1~~TRINITY_DN3589_c0_g1_i3.p1  ORF type:complete len:532 (+),score=143.36 TRINITY_DN3589_c0_g1_i3:97-1692(+)